MMHSRLECPSCQQLIEEMQLLMSDNPGLLTEEQKKDREALLQQKERMSEYDFKRPEGMRPRGSRYCDYYGNEISIQIWSMAFEYGNAVINQEIVNGYLVSTVWLGNNHSYFGGLQIFETMIFEDKEDGNCALDMYQERYATLEGAKEGHKRACDFVREKTEGRK